MVAISHGLPVKVLDLLCRDHPLQQNSREVGERTAFPAPARPQQITVTWGRVMVMRRGFRKRKRCCF
jgi:hypothetical protein